MISIESKFNQAVASLNKAGLYEKFNKQFTNIKESSIEVKLNCALEVLKAAGIIESINESGWALTFAPKAKIRKNNGASFTESAGQITETAVVTKKEALVESVMRSDNQGAINPLIGKMTEAGARAFMGLAPKTPEGLKGYQLAEYRHFRKCGINESDALKMAKQPLRAPRA
jgi:hypothetical protein